MPYRFAATVTNPQKTAITQDFAAATGWTAQSGLTKSKWLDNKIDAYVRTVTRDYRTNAARVAAEAAAIADMVGLEEP